MTSSVFPLLPIKHFSKNGSAALNNYKNIYISTGFRHLKTARTGLWSLRERKQISQPYAWHGLLSEVSFQAVVQGKRNQTKPSNLNQLKGQKLGWKEVEEAQCVWKNMGEELTAQRESFRGLQRGGFLAYLPYYWSEHE